MGDLLSGSQVADFKAAMRSVADTFQRFPVELDLAGAGVVTALVCGRKVLEGKLDSEAAGDEVRERLMLSFNREYLAELGLVDGVSGALSLGYDDEWLVDGKRYFVLSLKEDAVFRGDKLLVFVEIGR